MSTPSHDPLWAATSPLHPLFHCTSRTERTCRRCGGVITAGSCWWGTRSVRYCEACYGTMRGAERLAPFTRWKETGKQATVAELEAWALAREMAKEATA